MYIKLKNGLNNLQLLNTYKIPKNKIGKIALSKKILWINSYSVLHIILVPSQIKIIHSQHIFSI